ncbi:pyridoxamine 5'-phosphate oxidase family protein [Nocardiopsis coralliicola]
MGERLAQSLYGTEQRAERFYRDQMGDRLNAAMREFVARQDMLFIATADARGDCDSSFRAGPPGFVHVINDRTLAYPEYRGNGVLASVGNITENPRIGLMFLDFTADRIGLHVNGRARLADDAELRADVVDLPVPENPGQRPVLWVIVAVDEAYIHCRKHIPRLRRVGEGDDWGTDDPQRKGGDFFGVRADRS